MSVLLSNSDSSVPIYLNLFLLMIISFSFVDNIFAYNFPLNTLVVKLTGFQESCRVNGKAAGCYCWRAPGYYVWLSGYLEWRSVTFWIIIPNLFCFHFASIWFLWRSIGEKHEELRIKSEKEKKDLLLLYWNSLMQWNSEKWCVIFWTQRLQKNATHNMNVVFLETHLELS